MNPLHEPSLRSRATVMRPATEPVDKSGVWNAGEMARRAGDLSVATEKSRHPGEFSDGAGAGAERSGAGAERSGAGAERERASQSYSTMCMARAASEMEPEREG
jgi:hypothetical protein